MDFTQSRSRSNNPKIANNNNLAFTVNKKVNGDDCPPTYALCTEFIDNLCAQEKDAKGVIFGVLVQMRGWGRAVHIAFLKDPFSLKTTCNHSKYWNIPTF